VRHSPVRRLAVTLSKDKWIFLKTGLTDMRKQINGLSYNVGPGDVELGVLINS
jgi:hypothetical protein